MKNILFLVLVTISCLSCQSDSKGSKDQESKDSLDTKVEQNSSDTTPTTVNNVIWRKLKNKLKTDFFELDGGVLTVLDPTLWEFDKSNNMLVYKKPGNQCSFSCRCPKGYSDGGCVVSYTEKVAYCSGSDCAHPEIATKTSCGWHVGGSSLTGKGIKDEWFAENLNPEVKLDPVVKP